MGGFLTPLSVFSDFQNAFADVLDSSSEVAGYLLGFLVVIMLLVIMYWTIKDSRVLMLAGLSGIVLVVLIGWWPVWSLILMIIAMAVLLFRMPGLGGGGGID
jgi:biotin transporter BioY